MDLNLYYRALAEYRKHTKENRTSEKQRKNIRAANAENDKIELVTTTCIIDDDWITAIEKGLIHVEKAIKEERQFIRSNGEVVPIEKVKQVSKDSVEHLARHSNLMTRKPEGSSIIPDSLFTVERLSDYAVYENRFLYMLLCFLRDFITFRYDKILELTNTYNGSLQLNKKVHAGNRRLEYSLQFNEIIKNDPYLKANNPAKEQIDRIDLILKTVIAFLNTPLMESVAKAPVLKPPITETNVLKMNKNFKGAKELYYFISSYTKQGYTVQKNVQTVSPFGDDIADEFAETVELNSFLTYEHSLGLEKQLKSEYEKTEREQKELEKQKRAEQLKNLKKRIKQSGGSIEDYLIALEQRNKTLESDCMQLSSAKAEFLRLENTIAELNKKLEGLNGEIHIRDEKIDEQNRTFAEQIAEAEQRRTEEVNDKVNRFNAELSRVVQEYNEKIAAQREECEQLVNQAEKEKAEKVELYNKLSGTINKITDEKLVTQARLNALLYEQGMSSVENDFSTRESFDDIERQYKAFKAFFNGEWKQAKRRIRREILGSGNMKDIEEQGYGYDTSADFRPIFGPTKPPKQSENNEENKDG